MRGYNYNLDQALNLGYFEAHRLWCILDELKAYDLKTKIIINDMANATEYYRKDVLNWIDSRIHKTNKSSEIPEDVLRKFAEEFNNG